MDHWELWESSLTKDVKRLDWTNLQRSCLKSGCPSARMEWHRGLCVRLTRHWSSPWIPGPETHHTMIGIAPLVDHGLHGWVRSCGTPDCCWRMGSCWRPVNMEGATTHSRLCAAVSEWVSAGEWWIFWTSDEMLIVILIAPTNWTV